MSKTDLVTRIERLLLSGSKAEDLIAAVYDDLMEPTEAMQEAGDTQIAGDTGGLRGVWQAMLTARRRELALATPVEPPDSDKELGL